MTQETETGQVDVMATISRDAAEAKKSLVERFSIAIRKPITIVIAGFVFVLTLGFEYIFSRTLDALWEAEPPEEIVRLNSELQSSSGELQQTTRRLQSLVSSINTDSVEDPRLKAQLEQLNSLLPGLNDLVTQASSNTDRVATYAQTLHDDWVRLQSRSDGAIDGVPDLLLANGEGVELCNGLTSFGVRQIQRGRVLYNTADTNSDVVSGGRISLGERAYLDYLGSREGMAMFKVNCG